MKKKSRVNSSNGLLKSAMAYLVLRFCKSTSNCLAFLCAVLYFLDISSWMAWGTTAPSSPPYSDESESKSSAKWYSVLWFRDAAIRYLDRISSRYHPKNEIEIGSNFGEFGENPRYRGAILYVNGPIPVLRFRFSFYPACSARLGSGSIERATGNVITTVFCFASSSS